jgi:hypothetical protein
MTPAASLVAVADRLGVRLEPRGPKLGIIPPAEVPADEWAGLVEGLTEFKAEVLELLSVARPREWSSRSCPAWCDDDSLAVPMDQIRAAVAECSPTSEPRRMQ